MDWFPVSVITSETRTLERKKEQFVKAKNIKQCNLQESRSSTNEGMSREDKNEIRQPKGQKEKTFIDPGPITFCDHVQTAGNKRKKVSIIDVREMVDIKKAIKLSRRFISKNKYAKNLENALNLRNLRIVDVPGDGNCFFHAVSHQLFGDISSQHLVRQAALDQVLNNPELYQDFLVNKDIGTFASTLSEDRGWTDNHNIQTTADAFGESIEIINSSSERFSPVTVIPQGIPENLIRKNIVLGHIGHIHFVSTEFNPPFPLCFSGGFSKKIEEKLYQYLPFRQTTNLASFHGSCI